MGNPTPETISKAPGQGRGFCALQDKFLVVSARDSMVYNYPRWDRTNNGSVRVDAFAGNQDLTPEEFLRTAEGFTPDLMVPLSDEMPAEALEPRVRLGVTRSLRSHASTSRCRTPSWFLIPSHSIQPDVYQLHCRERPCW